MGLSRFYLRMPLLTGMLVTIVIWLAGCSRAPSADVSPDAAAAKALELYDANHDGSIDKQELAKCPPLGAASGRIDADGNASLSLQEISLRLKQLFASSTSLMEYTCTVTLDGRPLSGATVHLRPVDMLKDAILPADAKTDAEGIARPTIAEDHLPAEFRSMPLIHAGLYHVEITHADIKILPRYNTSTEIGVEVDPTSRGGAGARFELKSK